MNARFLSALVTGCCSFLLAAGSTSAQSRFYDSPLVDRSATVGGLTQPLPAFSAYPANRALLRRYQFGQFELGPVPAFSAYSNYPYGRIRSFGSPLSVGKPFEHIRPAPTAYERFPSLRRAPFRNRETGEIEYRWWIF